MDGIEALLEGDAEGLDVGNELVSWLARQPGVGETIGSSDPLLNQPRAETPSSRAGPNPQQAPLSAG